MTKKFSGWNRTRLATGFGAAFVAAGALFILPSTAKAQVRMINLPQELCEYEPISRDLIDRIKARGDYDRILRYLAEECPQVALLFTDTPTASIGLDASAMGRDADNPIPFGRPNSPNAGSRPNGPPPVTPPGETGGPPPVVNPPVVNPPVVNPPVVNPPVVNPPVVNPPVGCEDSSCSDSDSTDGVADRINNGIFGTKSPGQSGPKEKGPGGDDFGQRDTIGSIVDKVKGSSRGKTGGSDSSSD